MIDVISLNFKTLNTAMSLHIATVWIWVYAHASMLVGYQAARVDDWTGRGNLHCDPFSQRSFVGSLKRGQPFRSLDTISTKRPFPITNRGGPRIKEPLGLRRLFVPLGPSARLGGSEISVL